MAKSSYIDNIINTQAGTNYRYLSELWNSNSLNTYDTYQYSITNNFSNTIDVAIASSDYLNNLDTNQTVLNMSNNYLSSVTLNPNYLPVKNPNNPLGMQYSKFDFVDGKRDEKGNIIPGTIMPADYLPAYISSIKGSTSYVIPVLFPKSFSRSISASFAKENPVGSTTPIVAYSYTDAEEIPFEFDALADYLPTGFSTLKQYVDAIINILKPSISGSEQNIINEPTVIVEFADMRFEGICTSVNVSYDNVYNYKSFVHASISCQFIRLK